jgi:hypothetical protein
MSAHTQLLRVKRLKSLYELEMAARHNLREIRAENGFYGRIDGRTSGENELMRGGATAREVVAQTRLLLDSAGIKNPRKNAVAGIEIVIGLRPNSDVNQQEFFSASLEWVDAYFRVPIVSAVIHHDEGAPHMQMLLVPLIDGRLRGSELVSSRYKIIALHANFHEVVGKTFGLAYVPKKQRQGFGFPIGNEGVRDFTIGIAKPESHSLSCVRESEISPLSKQARMELLTYQFTEGIRQKIAAGNRGWAC